jgi:hypothetical protein
VNYTETGYYEVRVQRSYEIGYSHVAFFRNYDTCIEYIRKQPNPQNYAVRECKIGIIFDSVEEYEQFRLNETRDRLMKTLTPIEKKALGLA